MFNLNRKPSQKKAFVLPNNPMVQCVVVQSRSVRILEEFKAFLLQNAGMVMSMLSDSKETKDFVEESCDFLRMEVHSVAKNQLALKVVSTGWAVYYYEHVAESDDDDAHFDIADVKYFGQEELHKAAEYFMTRWNSLI